MHASSNNRTARAVVAAGVLLFCLIGLAQSASALAAPKAKGWGDSEKDCKKDPKKCKATTTTTKPKETTTTVAETTTTAGATTTTAGATTTTAGATTTTAGATTTTAGETTTTAGATTTVLETTSTEAGAVEDRTTIMVTTDDETVGSEELARTGSEEIKLAVLALMALGAGAVCVSAARRRSSES